MKQVPSFSLSEDEIKNLISLAQSARENAYAPYSNYKVGAAVLTGSGRIYTGCNVENASYGATICAERVAAASAIAAGEKKLWALAVVTEGEEPAAPCGLCRQFLAEFAPDLPIFMANTKGRLVTATLASYLPKAFTGRFLPDEEENCG